MEKGTIAWLGALIGLLAACVGLMKGCHEWRKAKAEADVAEAERQAKLQPQPPMPHPSLGMNGQTDKNKSAPFVVKATDPVLKTIQVGRKLESWDPRVAITLESIDLRMDNRMRWHFTFWN